VGKRKKDGKRCVSFSAGVNQGGSEGWKPGWGGDFGKGKGKEPAGGRNGAGQKVTFAVKEGFTGCRVGRGTRANKPAKPNQKEQGRGGKNNMLTQKYGLEKTGKGKRYNKGYCWGPSRRS